jgi:perosamine synthetase|tara:strand:- start:5304 stop:6425 length:1122 start_codon:yes stop_codon:yes gene_type:complete
MKVDLQKTITQVDIAVDSQEIELVEEVLKARWLSEGPKAKQLSEVISLKLKSPHVTFAPNGTLGLFLALLALDLPLGGEVIVPSFTFYGSVMPIVFAGLKPRFVDVDASTYNMTADAVKDAIGPNTVAVMPVHIYGQTCEIIDIVNIARENNLKVIEDAAQAFGVSEENKFAGTFGDIGVISFFSDKVITMGEGACIVVQDDKIFEKIRLLRNQGRPNSGTFVHPSYGMNFRITDMQAAVGLQQFGKFNDIKSKRLCLFERYRKALDGVGDIVPMEVSSNVTSFVPFRFPIATRSREALEAFMEKKGIQTRRFFCPMHLQPKLKESPVLSLPNSETLFETGLCLPIHYHISEDDVDYIVQTISEFFCNQSKRD